MDFELIKSEYRNGGKLTELSKKYGVPLAKLRYRCRKEKWGDFDKFAAIKEAADSTARLISQVSRMSEDIVSGGGKVEPRDIKYLTASEKELLEILRDVYNTPTLSDSFGMDLRRERLMRANEPTAVESAGVILIPQVDGE